MLNPQPQSPFWLSFTFLPQPSFWAKLSTFPFIQLTMISLQTFSFPDIIYFVTPAPLCTCGFFPLLDTPFSVLPYLSTTHRLTLRQPRRPAQTLTSNSEALCQCCYGTHLAYPLFLCAVALLSVSP